MIIILATAGVANVGLQHWITFSESNIVFDNIGFHELNTYDPKNVEVISHYETPDSEHFNISRYHGSEFNNIVNFGVQLLYQYCGKVYNKSHYQYFGGTRYTETDIVFNPSLGLFLQKSAQSLMIVESGYRVNLTKFNDTCERNITFDQPNAAAHFWRYLYPTASPVTELIYREIYLVDLNKKYHMVTEYTKNDPRNSHSIVFDDYKKFGSVISEKHTIFGPSSVRRVLITLPIF